jgi:hypothetical protein
MARCTARDEIAAELRGSSVDPYRIIDVLLKGDD